jgi:hypothetical protein
MSQGRASSPSPLAAEPAERIKVQRSTWNGLRFAARPRSAWRRHCRRRDRSCNALDNRERAGHSATMKRLDQGLGALGLLSLTAALALLLTIGIPITVSKDRVELKDWLGFAGNVVGAFVTLLAAVIAWYAVQRQIGVQREANLPSVMTREETRLENDLHAFEVCIALLATAHSAKVVYDAGGSYTELDKYVRELTLIGLSSDPIEMRRFIQTKVNSEMSPHLCTEVTSACANVMLAADLLQSLRASLDRGARLFDLPSEGIGDLSS